MRHREEQVAEDLTQVWFLEFRVKSAGGVFKRMFGMEDGGGGFGVKEIMWSCSPPTFRFKPWRLKG